MALLDRAYGFGDEGGAVNVLDWERLDLSRAHSALQRR
jgi:hypothetical protein